MKRVPTKINRACTERTVTSPRMAMQPRHDQITKPKQFMRQYNSHNLTKCEIQSLLDPDFFQASQNKSTSHSIAARLIPGATTSSQNNLETIKRIIATAIRQQHKTSPVFIDSITFIVPIIHSSPIRKAESRRHSHRRLSTGTGALLPSRRPSPFEPVRSFYAGGRETLFIHWRRKAVRDFKYDRLSALSEETRMACMNPA